MNNTNDYIEINGKKLYNHEFVGLHAHSAFSMFDGFGFPQEHMNFAYENGSRALALTDHGSMNGLSYQLLRAKEMKAEGKDFKPIFGVEAYYIESLSEWQNLKEQITQDKKRAKEIDKSDSAMVIEDEQRNDKRALSRKRHIVLLAQNQKFLENIYEMVSKSYSGYYFYRHCAHSVSWRHCRWFYVETSRRGRGCHCRGHDR